MRRATAMFCYRPAAFTAAVALSMSTLFAGIPVSSADPDDGDGGSSYDDGGGYDGGGYDDGGAYDEGGVDFDDPGEVDDGGMDDAPEVDDPADEDAPDSPGEDQQEPEQAPQPTGEEPGTEDEHPEDEHPDGEHPDSGPQEPSGTETPEPSVPETHSTDDDGPSPTADPDDEPDAEPQPDTADVPRDDATTARRGRVVGPRTTTRGARSYANKVKSAVPRPARSRGGRLNSPVKKWNSRWTSYDRYYRPVFINPYQAPLRVVYDSGGAPKTFTVPPLQRAVIDTPGPGVYSFTASTEAGSAPPTNISVGSFSGGGFKPAPGQAPPQKPAPLNIIKNALVQVTFDQGTSAPFRVRTLTDLGKDPAVGDSTRVLLDGEIPAWGQWSKDEHGEALFQISRTQLLPGVDPPAQDPLPGYDIKLVAGQQASPAQAQQHQNRTLLIGGGIAAVVVLAGVAITVVVVRRRRSGDQPENVDISHDG
ncbi:hypothetical protein [Mycolicibacterium aichiense]|uniref:Uncharacterized protein n=1 Tax=Mycolicibacterium aichiense TaxID=1799 RepID=A0AAD1HRP4_9MYCO|nr:hypothetical protein [Mycolicibacterium aichiense]MCV7017383.1 hypothetical protein [Mycolicibacterium aichiense]BBX10184.1 hypothetical protein MAIC_49870 [Mycolicibacterium aichiense]STZ26150.1 Uncharacterised protein [Mycolicibacterium aichiense]